MVSIFRARILLVQWRRYYIITERNIFLNNCHIQLFRVGIYVEFYNKTLTYHIACTETGLKICWRLHTLTLNPLKNKKYSSHIANEEMKENYPRTILL